MNGSAMLTVVAKLSAMEPIVVQALDAAIASKQPLPAPFDRIPAAALPVLEGALKLFLVGDELVTFLTGLKL